MLSGLNPDAGRDGTRERLMWGAFLLVALLMTLKYFPGLENPAAYAGNVFQAIHPDAFPKDPYIGPEKPLWQKGHQVSSFFYVLPKLMGEIWLDDRFIAFVYLGLAFAGAAGVDRIARLLGLEDPYGRLAIQLVLLRDHQILNNKVFLAHQPDFNHEAFAIPACIWLFYATLAGRRLRVILLWCVLVGLASIRNAPPVIATCLILAAVNGGRRERIVVSGVFAAALVVLYVMVSRVLVVPEQERLALWDVLYRNLTPSQVNPFAPEINVPLMLLWNATFVLLCVAAAAWPASDAPAVRNLRWLMGLWLGVWLISGLYFSFPPDFLKLPQILPFTPVRTLRWPQLLAYIAVMVLLLRWLEGKPDVARLFAAVAAVGVLVVIGPANWHLWAALYAAAAGAVLGFHRLRRTGARAATVVTQVLALAIGIAYAYSVAGRLPAWRTWAEAGVMGDSGPAPWIGVAEYVRAHTPADAVILPLQASPRDPEKLIATRHIATRSGRSTPLVNELYGMYSVDGWHTEHAQWRLRERVAEAFQGRRWTEAAAMFSEFLVRPDYVLVPQALVDAAKDGTSPFAEVARVKTHVLLRSPR